MVRQKNLSQALITPTTNQTMTKIITNLDWNELGQENEQNCKALSTLPKARNENIIHDNRINLLRKKL
ncbi:hypothetical protein [Gloeocapsopsis dulcis]|uniref:hypothetical protein n=1 Tax=Gloeocapsopsis dulcis TaxID=2859516 RepID=UPI00101AD5D0|nr:hypothetical protein [Gloeocapsopsis dulcis]WNN87598.1 hypothetical protein P0S91_14865 [Gloeocapsopsis dulcis]